LLTAPSLPQNWGLLILDIGEFGEVDLLRRFNHPLQNNKALMMLIDNYVNDHGEASMGTIETELNISISKQYKLSLAYRDLFQLLRLKKGWWIARAIVKGEVLPVPLSTQDQLTGV